MIVCNETPFEVELFRSALGKQRSLAVVVVKATVAFDETGRLTLDPSPVSVIRAPKSVFGFEMETDGTLAKPAVDVVTIGSARPLNGARTREMLVGFTVGDLHARAAVFGDRQWHKSTFGWRIGDPMPFESMPVSWSNAFGGVSRKRGVPALHPENPAGKGYVADLAELADGQALPNVEDPAALIRSPDDRPSPIGFEPLSATSPIRVQHSLAHASDASVSRAHFNVAHPRWQIPRLHGGTIVRLLGWHPHGADVFALPEIGLLADVRLEDRSYQYPLRLDCLCLFPNENRFTMTWRCVFSYSYIRGVRRVVRVVRSEIFDRDREVVHV
jgi:hypothetical protein